MKPRYTKFDFEKFLDSNGISDLQLAVLISCSYPGIRKMIKRKTIDRCLIKVIRKTYQNVEEYL